MHSSKNRICAVFANNGFKFISCIYLLTLEPFYISRIFNIIKLRDIIDGHKTLTVDTIDDVLPDLAQLVIFLKKYQNNDACRSSNG